MDFRSRLRDQIEYCGLLDKEVAARAGITKRAVDSYVGSRGCMPSAEIAVRLARVLGVTVEYLVTGKDNRINEHLQNPSYCAENPFTPEEKRLLKSFKSLNARDKKLLLSIACEMNSIASSAPYNLSHIK